MRYNASVLPSTTCRYSKLVLILEQYTRVCLRQHIVTFDTSRLGRRQILEVRHATRTDTCDSPSSMQSLLHKFRLLTSTTTIGKLHRAVNTRERLGRTKSPKIKWRSRSLKAVGAKVTLRPQKGRPAWDRDSEEKNGSQDKTCSDEKK